MGSCNLTRAEQRFYLNSGEVRGVQNLSLSYNTPSSPVKLLGVNNPVMLPAGIAIGKVNVNSTLISNDPFINYTGDAPVTGFLVDDKNVAKNFSFTNGYLINYTSTCAVGGVPEIGASFDILGNIGRLERNDAAYVYDTLQNPNDIATPVLHIVGPGSIQISSAAFPTTKILSYDLAINCAREYRSTIGSRNVFEIKSIMPLDVTCNFTLSAKDYQASKLSNYPQSFEAADIAIAVKDFNTQETILTYNLEDMDLIGESRSATTDANATVTLAFKGFINKKYDIITDKLLIYLNSAHQRSIIDAGTKWKNLAKENSYGTSTFNLESSKVDNRVVFPGLDFVDFDSTTLGSNVTICFWVKAAYLQNVIPISFDTDTYTYGLNFYFSGGVLYLNTGDSYDNPMIDFPQNSNNEWHHFAICLNGDSQGITVYVDDVLTEHFAGFRNPTLTNGKFRVGAWVNDDNFGIEGTVDNILVYNKVLTAKEIHQNYKATKI